MKSTTLQYKIISSLLIISLLMAGCGGHAPNPVDRYMLGDENKNAATLKAEVSNIDGEIAATKTSKTNRDIWNVVFVVTGILVIFPLFLWTLNARRKLR